ncbi:hypothetical protein GTQ34_16365 [Muricauda sp. JGD-17]|uniref:Lipoprotein n=1 Tax=Flagellimonas ochracea TaxID=2696472 RepID=A0A964WYZ4_9FLAO|nr:hypothetical protein [Allomuricauda ochracea]NAY93487.1 hypothetical protein [Allomuricauda ochracea]
MRVFFPLILILLVVSCRTDKKNGTVNNSGNSISSDSLERTGIWKYAVNNESIKDSIVEFLKINGRDYVNQIWLVNKERDTVGGNYFNMYLNDTTKLGEVTRIRFELAQPAISKDSEVYVLLPVEVSDLEEEFSNFFDLELDTVHSLKNDGISHPKLADSGLKLNHIVEFGIEYSTPGKKRIKGIISEKGLFNGKESERRLFFDESIWILE